MRLKNNPQVEDMRGELLRMRKEKAEPQRARLETSQSTAQLYGNHAGREEGRGGLQGPGTEFRSRLEGETHWQDWEDWVVGEMDRLIDSYNNSVTIEIAGNILCLLINFSMRKICRQCTCIPQQLDQKTFKSRKMCWAVGREMPEIRFGASKGKDR